MIGFKKEKGFSLVELLVVVGFIGMFLLVGIPAFSQMIKRYRLSTTTDNLASSLRLARQLSVSRQDRMVGGVMDGIPETVTAKINFTSNTYEVCYTGTTEQIRPTPEMPVGVRLESVKVESGGPLDYDSEYPDDSEFVFNDDGSISLPASGNTIIGDSIVFRLRLSPFTERRGVVKLNQSGMIKVFYVDITN